jgi:hypothetical protein
LSSNKWVTAPANKTGAQYLIDIGEEQNIFPDFHLDDKSTI